MSKISYESKKWMHTHTQNPVLKVLEREKRWKAWLESDMPMVGGEVMLTMVKDKSVIRH